MQLSGIRKQEVKTKKATQAISKYHYYQHKISIISKDQEKKDNTKLVINQAKVSNNIKYIYASYEKADIVEMPEHILHSIIFKHYLNQNSIKIRDTISQSISFNHTYLPITTTAAEILQFTTQQLVQTDIFQSRYVKPLKKKEQNLETIQMKKFKDKKPQKMTKYKIFVVHHYNPKQQDQSRQLRWENFVEQFKFEDGNIKYNMICAVKDEPSSLFSSLQLKNVAQNYINDFISLYSSQQRINKIIGNALQVYDEAMILTKIMIDKNDPVYSEDHNRVAKLPSEHYSKFQLIKKQLSQLELTDNLICRFLMVNKYETEPTIIHIKQYKEFITNIEKRASLLNFQYFYASDIYTYLGQDYSGKPVVLNKACNVRVDQFDVEEYCTFFIFWLQIFLVGKMRGKVDQYSIIADVKNLSMKNFKLSLTKRNVSQGLRYCPQRQYRIMAVNVNSFVKYCFYTFLRPLLPENTHHKILIAGNQKNEIVQQLGKFMNPDVVPKYLGGTNPEGNKNQQIEDDEQQRIMKLE